MGGAVYPLSFSIIRDEVPPARMGVAMGLISSMLGLGGGLGLVMSGVIVDHGSWRLLFVVGAVIGLLGIVLVARFVPSSPQRSAATLDIPGALLLSAGLICILVGAHRGPRLGLGLGPVPRRDRRRPRDPAVGLGGESHRQPMVDMRMLARRPVLFTNLAALFCGFTMYAIFTVLPLFAQMPSGLPRTSRRWSPTGSAPASRCRRCTSPGRWSCCPPGPSAASSARVTSASPSRSGR